MDKLTWKTGAPLESTQAFKEAVEDAFEKLREECPNADDLSKEKTREIVLTYDAFNLRLVVKAAIEAVLERMG